MSDIPVKIDSILKKRIESLIKKDYYRIEFPSVKNFIDKSVLKMLQEVENERKE